MSSCRLVRVFCKKEANKKVKALREELELKEKDIEEKDTKLNTLLQDPFGVIKLLATNYFNLRSIEEPSDVRTRQLTTEQAVAATVAVAAVSEKNSSDSDSDSDSDRDVIEGLMEKIEKIIDSLFKAETVADKAGELEELKALIETALEAAKEAGKLESEELEELEELAEKIEAAKASKLDEIEIFMSENYKINIVGCYKSILDNLGNLSNLSKKNIEDQLKKFINCCYNNYVVGLDAEEDEYYTEISEDTIIFTSKYGTDTLTRKMMNPYYDAPYKKVIIYGFINIGNGAFRDWYTNLEEVVIGDSVVNIGEKVFYACNGITKIVIGNAVETIGKFTFSYCYNISPVVISDETAKQLNLKWSSPSTVPALDFYGNSKPVEFILPEV
jgi:hypothetical protein